MPRGRKPKNKTNEGQLRTSGEVRTSKKAQKAPTFGHNSALRAEAITATFNQALTIEKQITALTAKYLDPLKDQRTELWRKLKADTGIDSSDAKLFYKIFKREKLADEFDDEADRERVFDNLREVYNALAAGEQLDFIAAIETTPRAGAGDAGGEAGPDFSRLSVEEAERLGREHCAKGSLNQPPDGMEDPALRRAFMRGWEANAAERLGGSQGSAATH